MSRQYKEMRLDNLLNAPNTLFKIPIYQRHYCWDTSLISDMIEDLFSIKKGVDYHLGEIIYMCHRSEDNTLVYQLIDGQQRITTLFLFKLAQYRYILDNISILNTQKYKPILKNLLKYLLISDCNTNDDMLFCPTQTFVRNELKIQTQSEENNNLLLSLINTGTYDTIFEKTHIIQNYCLLYNNIKNHIDISKQDDIISAYSVFSIQEIMDDYESGYKCFININKKRVMMTDIELIKAYFLFDNQISKIMCEKLDALINILNPIKNIRKNPKTDPLQRFIQTYLLFHTNNTIIKKNVYKNLQIYIQTYANDNKISINDSKIFFLDDCIEWAKEYMFLHSYKNTKHIIFYHFTNHSEYVRDLMLFLHMKYKKNEITEQLYNQTVTTISKIVLALSINLNRSVGEYYRTLFFKMINNKNPKKWEETLIEFKRLYKSMLSKESMQFNLSKMDFFKFKMNKTILTIIESNLDSECDENTIHTLMKLSLDHIHPQTCDTDIKYDGISTEKIHTMGNITLTNIGKNSKMSNDNWINKKVRLCNCQRPYVINKNLQHYVMWNDNSINKRFEWYWTEFSKFFDN